MLLQASICSQGRVALQESSQTRHPGLNMARSSKLITACVALAVCVALRSLAFLSSPAPATQLRGSTPLEVAAGAAVPAVMMTPTAAMAADGEGMPSVVLGVGILCTTVARWP